MNADRVRQPGSGIVRTVLPASGRPPGPGLAAP